MCVLFLVSFAGVEPAGVGLGALDHPLALASFDAAQLAVNPLKGSGSGGISVVCHAVQVVQGFSAGFGAVISHAEGGGGIVEGVGDFVGFHGCRLVCCWCLMTTDDNPP